MRCTGALSVVLGVCRKQRIVVLCNHYTNYTKAKKYLTKLPMSKNVQYNEIQQSAAAASDITSSRRLSYELRSALPVGVFLVRSLINH